MKKSHRYITSLLLTMIYLLIIFSPMAPLAMQSKLVAHAVTGECTGDCRIDGCSLERCADHTCCCWQKKQHEYENAVESEPVSSPAPQKKMATTVSSRPCGNGTLFALLNIETTHHLPSFFTREIPSPIQSTLTFIPPDCLTSRYGDPPDPPPKLFILS